MAPIKHQSNKPCTKPGQLFTVTLHSKLRTVLRNRPAVPKLFLNACHLWALYFHRVPPWKHCSRKTHSTQYHSIKSLANQTWHKCGINKMPVRNY